MQIHGYADASFKTQDGKTQSVEGRILFLTNGKKASPILWKSNVVVVYVDVVVCCHFCFVIVAAVLAMLAVIDVVVIVKIPMTTQRNTTSTQKCGWTQK